MTTTFALVAIASLSGLGEIGGGEIFRQSNDCIRESESRAIRAACQFSFRSDMPQTGTRRKYPNIPIGATQWQDSPVTGFVDVKPGVGAMDWDCTNFTYDFHTGHDMVIRGFAEQEIGVPVFSALDGVVIAAVDGHPDHNVNHEPTPPNYVVIDHGRGQNVTYMHLKRNSVTVTIGQWVEAGEQIGEIGSSGNSTGPHLHFQSMLNGITYEPSTGCGNPGESGWENQIPIRRDLYLLDFNMTDVRAGDFPGPPWDIPRQGTFVVGTQRSLGWWLYLCNVPARSNWLFRVQRPDGSSAHETWGNYLNAFPYNFSYWWYRYFVDLDVVGTWHVEMHVNGVPIHRAPFLVVALPEEQVNRPPLPVRASFDPPRPDPSRPLYCRVITSLIDDDPDYDVIRYRYRWTVDGFVVRDVVTAGQADCIPAFSFTARSKIQCTVTPSDGQLDGDFVVAEFPAKADQAIKR